MGKWVGAGLAGTAAITFSIRFRKITDDWPGTGNRDLDQDQDQLSEGQANAISAMQMSVLDLWGGRGGLAARRIVQYCTYIYIDIPN